MCQSGEVFDAEGFPKEAKQEAQPGQFGCRASPTRTTGWREEEVGKGGGRRKGRGRGGEGEGEGKKREGVEGEAELRGAGLVLVLSHVMQRAAGSTAAELPELREDRKALRCCSVPPNLWTA